MSDNAGIFLPKNCVYYKENGNNVAYLIEIRPDVFPLLFDDHYVMRQYSVAMPWQYMYFSVYKFQTDSLLNGARLFWSKHRLEGPDSPVTIARLPNVYRGYGNICFGSALWDSVIEQSPAEKINNTIDAFYTSPFNNDLGLPTPYGGDLEKWEKLSKANPLIWTSWRYSVIPLRRRVGGIR